ncbi:MAG: hypothetical protein IPG64_13855 [Haliea sp.]|nr:hypothetical protein [Haliea sp.]
MRNLLSELQEKHPYIITHGAYKTQVEKRQRSVLDAFDRMLANRRFTECLSQRLVTCNASNFSAGN